MARPSLELGRHGPAGERRAAGHLALVLGVRRGRLLASLRRGRGRVALLGRPLGLGHGRGELCGPRPGLSAVRAGGGGHLAR
ncbi:hypothetical protein, partial [Streptomyces inhibens]|uniref:hypothetical protein n=1 Tax=Streptomyces inhibens TaxID=2293571 RepID=UPI001C6E4048